MRTAVPTTIGASVAGLALAAVLAGPARADQMLYSYDPASPPTRELAPTGLTFLFDKRAFGGAAIRRIIQTGERGSADLKSASESGLGAGGLKAGLGGKPAVGHLYEIAGDRDGKAFVSAVCPGAARAWLVIGPLRRFRDLRIQAVGRDAGAAGPKPCAELLLSFHNDWVMPHRPPPRVRFPRNLP